MSVKPTEVFECTVHGIRPGPYCDRCGRAMVATQYVPLQTFLTAVGELRDTRESLAIVREAARRARTMLKPGSTVGVGAVRDSLGEALLASEKTKAAA